MITGYLENGRPHVSVHVEIPRLNIRGTIPLLVDTGADNTCTHLKDGAELLITLKFAMRHKVGRQPDATQPWRNSQ